MTTADDQQPEPVLSDEAHSSLFEEWAQLHEYRYGNGPDCFSGSTGELVDSVDDLRQYAATHDPHPNFGMGDNR
jgi:hypothetical protein